MFLLIANLMLCLVFIFVTYFFGHNNAEMNFHYCTGCSHIKNIEDTLALWRRHGNMTVSSVWFQTSIGPDPLEYFTYICLFSLISITFLTLFYKHELDFKAISFCSFLKVRKLVGPMTSKHQSYEAENFSFEAGQTFGILLLGILFITPAALVKKIASTDDNSLNYGYGRICVYATHISIFFFYLNVFPLWIILTNPKMFQSLKREIREYRLVKKISPVV